LVDQHSAIGPGGSQLRAAADSIHLAFDLALRAVLRDPAHLNLTLEEP
jgi:hypothetical protein